jgi:hypothetical protein
MKVLIVTLALLLLAGSSLADFTIKIDPDLDYFEPSGVTPIPQMYQQTPTVETLRDLLVLVGIMSPRPTGYVTTFQDDPTVKAVFQDDPTVKIVFQDVPEITVYLP